MTGRLPEFAMCGIIAAAFLYGAAPGWCVPADDFDLRGSYERRLGEDHWERIYSVYTPGHDWKAMQKYAARMKWGGKGNRTTVLFFDDWRNTPDVSFSGMNFSDYYRQHWVAAYWHYPDGNILFVKHPAKKRTIWYE